MAGASVDARHGGGTQELELGHQSLCSILMEDMAPANSTSMASQASNSRRDDLQLDGREKEQLHADTTVDKQLGDRRPCTMSQSDSTLQKSQNMPVHPSLHAYAYASSTAGTHPAANSTGYGYSAASSSTSYSDSSSDLLDLLRESLVASPRSSAWPSSASTTRTTPSPSSSSAPSSGPPSPPHTSPSITSRRKSTSSAIAAPFTASTHALSFAISKTSKVATSLVTVHQAISLSLYVLVSLIASITLICILVAGYGLTLADDLKYKIGILGQKADQRRRKILFELEEWLRITNENLKKRQTALEQGSLPSPPRRRRRSSYPSTSRSKKSGFKDNREGQPKDTFDTLRRYASIAYSNLPFPRPHLGSLSDSNTLKKAKSQPPSRPRSRCSSPPPERDSSSPPSSKGSSSSSSSSSARSKLPPRPPLSVLIPSMIIALVLALVALFKNGRKKTARK